MLYPQNNRCRQIIDLCGFWEIRLDKDGNGIERGFHDGFVPAAEVGVPGSWNEQLSEFGIMNYVGKVWYQRDFFVMDLSDDRLLLRFGSVDYCAKVWINGNFVGEHTGGYLPFEFDISRIVKRGKNHLVVLVDNRLTHDTIPQGLTPQDYEEFDNSGGVTYPPTVFDFFTYGGIHRPVKLIKTNKNYLKNLKIDTDIHKDKGVVKFKAVYDCEDQLSRVRVSILNGDESLTAEEYKLNKKEIYGEITIKNYKAWHPANPHLYTLHFELEKNNAILDEYQQTFGIRTVRIENNQLLLNDKPIFLKGFGKHEDFPVLGKGLSYPLIVKDFQLMRWIGANSFRTSHYPYSEETMDMADRMGFLVIDEVPAVSLNFKYSTNKTLENHKKALGELIQRDYNHPSVVMWSVANEPGIWREKEAISNKAHKYWQEIFDHTRRLDATRPITLPTCSVWGIKDLAYKYSDIISINRYWGWYEIPGDIKRVGEIIKEEIKELYKKYNKPIFVSEFGADTIAGEHATVPQMFTEEYQIELIKKYFEVIESLACTIGEHVWNFADFRTAQHYRRVVLNRKGVFNRERAPKSVAFYIRDHWTDGKETDKRE